MKITKEHLKQLIKEELAHLSEHGDWEDTLPAEDAPAEDATAAAEPILREPWDGIEANADMIGNNAIKIEYLARKLGIEIPVDPKL